MKIVILYKPVSELASSVESYAKEFERETGQSINLLNSESHEGIALAGVHDIVRQPVLLVLQDNSELVEVWQERDSWPTMSQLSAYLN
jgi:hypothetical protein